MNNFKSHIIILTILFCSVPLLNYAQNKTSLFKSASSITPKSIEKKLLHAQSLFNDSLSTALTIIEDNIMLAVKYNFIKQESLGYRILGDFNADLSNHLLAKTNYNKALKLQSKIGDEFILAQLYQKIGDVEFKTQNFTIAQKNYKKSLSFYTKINSTSNSIIVKHKLAKLYIKQKQYNKALSLYQSTQKKASTNQLLNLKIESILGDGKVNQLMGNILVAELKYQEAIDLAEINNLDALANKGYNLKTKILLDQNRKNEGIQIQQQAYNFNLNRSNTNFLIQNTVNISQEYVEQGETKKALELLNSNEKQISNSIQNEIESEVKLDYLKTLAEVYETEGLIEKANLETNKYHSLIDSLVKSKAKKEIILKDKADALKLSENKMLLLEQNRALDERMIAVLQLEKKTNNETIKKQRIINYLLFGGLLIIGVLAVLLYRSSKQKQKNNNLLQLKSLRSQMNPHFIFNSLNSVNSFIAKKDERSANKYLAEFSKLMREVLECSQQDFIPLAKEIEILKLYLNLEHFRFNSHFDYTFTVDPTINLDEHQIPPMLLQPFIENAIWHGLRYKKTKGHLNIEFKQKTNCIEIIISDDGIGRKGSKEVKTINQKKMKSTGIKNIENRLEIIRSVFKKKLDITILDNDKVNQTGTIVNVKLY